MKSQKSSMLRNLNRDLLTTDADIAALKHTRKMQKLDLRDYLKFLSNFQDAPTRFLRARKGPTGDKVFELE
jgi:hypothetical protein